MSFKAKKSIHFAENRWLTAVFFYYAFKNESKWRNMKILPRLNQG